MRRNVIETVMGGVVLIVAAFFVVFAYTSVGLDVVEGYQVSARFERIDGMDVGSDVRMSGVKVGTVTGQELDTETYQALVHMSIDPKLELPTDTMAEITSEGLLAGPYISLLPGGSPDIIPAGGEIEYTASKPSLTQLLGQVVYKIGSLSDELKGQTGGNDQGGQ